MNAVADEAKPQIPASVAPAPLLRAVLVCDLADSAQLTQRLGDVEAAELAQRLDRIARDLVYRHRGQEIDKSDGFLLLFERPVYAVAFALDYQRRLRELATTESLPLSARIGIHVGDVVLWENSPEDVARGAKPTEVEGLAKPVAARLMSLALPGQILISAVACMLAQRAQAELVAQRAPPQWKMHGRYQFKGVAEPLQVYEVGETGIAPLKRPAYSGKAHREVPWWRRPGMLALEAAALIAAVAAPAYLWLRSPPAIAFAQRDWVVIGDLNNLTREIVLDGSLESAFRLGLEQSRYVNVMSDLKVRDTLTLMQRDSAHTRVDRAIGSEVAIRDGARALIIPTVAEVGGHVRVTAEVIDPRTQTTVYTESADGKGLNSVLPTIDAIDQKLRLRLGEALASVTTDSKPLEQVATENLDALKSYGLGQRAYFTGDMRDALAQYQQALDLDPDFATARIAVAIVHLNAGQNSLALKDLREVSAHRERLISRDALYADARQAVLVDPRSGLEKLKSVADLYPEFFPVQGAYAYYAWTQTRYSAAMGAARRNAVAKNPHSAAGTELVAILHLTGDRFDDARREFVAASQAGFSRNDFFATLAAAQRRFEEAESLLDRGKPAGVPSDDIDTLVVRITMAVDQGKWSTMDATLDAADQQAARVGARNQQRFDGIKLGLHSMFGKDGANTFASYAHSEAAAVAALDNGIDRDAAAFHALFAAYLAARSGNNRLPAEILAKVPVAADDFPLSNLRAIITAEMEMTAGHADRAVTALVPLVDGNELYLTHVVLLDAYAMNHDEEQALLEAQWLAEHRGRAYGEYGAHQFLTAYDVAQSNLALLRAAELSLHTTPAAARDWLARFKSAWPDFTQITSVSTRVSALEKAL